MRARRRWGGGRAAAALIAVAAGQAGGAATLAAQAAASEQRTVARAERLRDGGRSAEAAEALREHLDRVPGSLAALALLGELALEAGEAAAFVPYAEAARGVAPDAEAARLWWARALSGAGLLDSARAVTGRWLEDAPQSVAARLARADVALAAGDSAAAVRVLDDTPAPSLETLSRLADLLIERGDVDRLAAVWAGLLGLDPPAVDEVERGIRAVGPGTAGVEGLFGQLGGKGPAARAGAIVALRAGRAAAGRELAEGELGAGAAEDAALLREYVRAAEAAGAAEEVAWAAGLLVGLSPRPADRVRWQSLAAEHSLAAGDTLAGRRALATLARESDPGEGPHEFASRRLFDLLAHDPASLGAAAEALDRYVRQYPDSAAAEAAMRGELALGHARAGDLAAAEAVLAEARTRLRVASTGPLDAAAAQLALYAGRRDSARERARRSVRDPGIDAAERTRRLALLTLVQAADTAETRIVGAAAHALLASPGAFDPGPALRELAGAPASAGRPAALAFLAGAAAAADRREIAGALRLRIVERHPASPAAPEALLALARAAPPPEAAVWLERLIVGYPRSALAPVARRLLAEIDGDLR